MLSAKLQSGACYRRKGPTIASLSLRAAVIAATAIRYRSRH